MLPFLFYARLISPCTKKGWKERCVLSLFPRSKRRVGKVISRDIFQCREIRAAEERRRKKRQYAGLRVSALLCCNPQLQYRQERKKKDAENNKTTLSIMNNWEKRPFESFILPRIQRDITRTERGKKEIDPRKIGWEKLSLCGTNRGLIISCLKLGLRSLRDENKEKERKLYLCFECGSNMLSQRGKFVAADSGKLPHQTCFCSFKRFCLVLGWAGNLFGNMEGGWVFLWSRIALSLDIHWYDKSLKKIANKKNLYFPLYILWSL